MRVLFSSTPEASHLAPQLPLALELAARGHDVLVACCPKLAQWAQRLGLAAASCGLDLDPDRIDFQAAGIELSLPDDLTPETMNAWANRAVFAEVFAPPMATDLRQVADEFRPDVMVRDRGEYAGWAVGTALGIPVVTVTFGKVADRGFNVATAGGSLQRLLDAQGGPSDPELRTLYAGPVLVPAPPSYADPTVDVLPSVHFVQPMSLDARHGDQLPDWVEHLGGPTVYVTLGNIFNTAMDGASLFEEMIASLAGEPIDVIVTVGRSVDPAGFGPAPPNVHIERYIPQSMLLPHVDAVVCHGGFNTVMGALGAGLPLVLLPLSADQPMHAAQCARLGAAVVVDAHPLDRAVLRDAVRAVLRETRFADAARRIATEIAGLADLAATADLVERAVEARP